MEETICNANAPNSHEKRVCGVVGQREDESTATGMERKERERTADSAAKETFASPLSIRDEYYFAKGAE